VSDLSLSSEARGGQVISHVAAGELQVLGSGATSGKCLVRIGASRVDTHTHKHKEKAPEHAGDKLRVVATYTAPWHHSYAGVGNALTGSFSHCDVRWDQGGVLDILRVLPPPSLVTQQQQQQQTPPEEAEEVDVDTKEWFALREQELRDACVRLWWQTNKHARTRLEASAPAQCGSCGTEEEEADSSDYFRCQRCDESWCEECVWDACGFFVLDAHPPSSAGLVCHACRDVCVEDLHDDSKQSWAVESLSVVLSNEHTGLCDVRGSHIRFSTMKTKVSTPWAVCVCVCLLCVYVYETRI
jgi:hypothetical protein